MNLKRIKMSIEDFTSIKLIGKGAFGIVRIDDILTIRHCFTIYLNVGGIGAEKRIMGKFHWPSKNIEKDGNVKTRTIGTMSDLSVIY